MAHNDLHIWIKYLSEPNLPLHPHNQNLSPSLVNPYKNIQTNNPVTYTKHEN